MTKRISIVLAFLAPAALLAAGCSSVQKGAQFPVSYAAFDPDCGAVLKNNEPRGDKQVAICTRLQASYDKILRLCQSESHWNMGMRGKYYEGQIDSYNGCMRSALFERRASALWIPRPSAERKEFSNIVGGGCSKELGCL